MILIWYSKVLYKDLKINSPYNTYKIGLPPGPITMPDISSVDAVLNAESPITSFLLLTPKIPVTIYLQVPTASTLSIEKRMFAGSMKSIMR